MLVCTFFGHRDAPPVEQQLQEVLYDLVVHKGVNHFLVGHNGKFDGQVLCVLRDLQEQFPWIRYAVVLAYMPSVREISLPTGTPTICPEGLEYTPPRFAIDRRNRYMAEQADYVVTFLRRPIGGAYKYAAWAEKKGKTLVRL